MILDYWIQRADFSDAGAGKASLADARRLVTDHDWAAEEELARSLEADGKDFCDAGIGFVREIPHHILHFCPRADHLMMVFYHHQRPARFLGLIPYLSDICASVSDASFDDAPELLRRFFDGDENWLKTYFDGHS